VKRRVNPGLGCGTFATAQRTIQGSEAMYRLDKSQLEGVTKRDVLAQNRAINQLFGIAASREPTILFSQSPEFLQPNRLLRQEAKQSAMLGVIYLSAFSSYAPGRPRAGGLSL
jgi:hypothetical protein